MALANPSIAKSKYVSFQVEFAEKYAERIKKEIEELSLEAVESYKMKEWTTSLALIILK